MAKRANGTFSFTFANGIMAWTAADGHGVKYDLNRSPVYKTLDDFDRAVYDNGVKQKIADSGALPANKETGKPAAASEKIAAMQKTVDALVSRAWTADRESGNVNLLLTALYRAFPKADAKSLGDKVSAMKPAEVTAMIKNPPAKLRPILDAIQAERVKSLGVDTEAMFANLSKM